MASDQAPATRAGFTCATCLAFAPGADRTVRGKVLGTCRRQSPAPKPAGGAAYHDAQWPDVRPDDWCCEYLARDADLGQAPQRGDRA